MDFDVGFSQDDGVLLISDTAASVTVSKITETHSVGMEAETCTALESDSRQMMLLALLSPENPMWTSYLPSLTNLHFSNRLRIGLRFHINSSGLWRAKTLLYKQLSEPLTQEVSFLGKLSEFKDFNYHLFDHWTSITSPASLIEIELPILRRFILNHPANFSPFHVILTSIQRSDDVWGLTCKVLQALSLPDSITTSPAYRDFLVSAALLCGLDPLNLPAPFSLFRNEIMEYTAA